MEYLAKRAGGDFRRRHNHLVHRCGKWPGVVRKCGGCVANHKPMVDMTVVYPMTLAGSGLKFVPASHIYCAERVMDIADGLPKFVDMPEAFRGSGETVDEPNATGWCG